MALFGLLSGLVVAEVLLSSQTTGRDVYYPWLPNRVRVFHPGPDVFPGIEGESVFRTNSVGMRGDEPSADDSFRVLAVGGSTTECLFLDQEEAWPQALEAHLDSAAPAQRTWVANVGKSAHHTRDHITMLRHLLPQLDDLDLVVLLVGTNDLTLRLAQGDDYDPDYMSRPEAEGELLKRSFQRLPVDQDWRIPFIKRTNLWSTLRAVKTRFLPSREVQDDAGRAYDLWREHRRTATVVHSELPDMTAALGEYRRNLNTLIDLCEAAEVRVVLLTQPFIWFDDMPQEVVETLWLGGIGNFLKEPGCEYYSREALKLGLETYNRVLAEVAEARGVEVCDLSEVLSGSAVHFYDDIHFNEAGSALVARTVAQHLLERPPFR